MNKEDLRKFVQDNPKLVTMRPAGDDIYVLKYRKTVFFDNLWNDYLEECRGTIVDKDFNIVSYPFTKVYNYGVESKAPILSGDTMVDAYRKVNGFMIAVTWHNGDILVSTTGSTANDYVDMAKELMQAELWRYREVCEKYSNYTFMFECVHRNDPHIIPETEGMYYLGHRAKSWGSVVEVSKDIPDLLNCYGTERLRVSMDELQKLVKEVRHEGFVFYTDSGLSSKIKSPWYLTNKWVARNPRTDKLVNMQNDIKKNLDEEYYPLVDAIRANIDEYTLMDEQARLAWVRKFFGY